MRTKNKLGFVTFCAALSMFSVSAAYADSNYTLTIKNASAMPISSGVVYAIEGEASDSEVNGTPTQGLIDLCQMGNPTQKIAELKANKNVTWLTQTQGPFLPGQQITVQAAVPHPETQSLHFVAMYGESKELCSAWHLSSQTLRSLRPGNEIIQNDQVISAGAATDPALPVGGTSGLCTDATNAVGCLRELTQAKATVGPIHFFAGYLPSVIDFLESKFGSADTLTLFVPTSGAVSITAQRQ